uniref:Uncharacterized protein n=1 Tax=Tanacetum cinerariifolium TaxID=118510 RepID=A0A6L2M7Z6_TANCI|nr:hypothetical protein [Tanacetum cinerariifolium]
MSAKGEQSVRNSRLFVGRAGIRFTWLAPLAPMSAPTYKGAAHSRTLPFFSFPVENQKGFIDELTYVRRNKCSPLMCALPRLRTPRNQAMRGGEGIRGDEVLNWMSSGVIKERARPLVDGDKEEVGDLSLEAMEDDEVVLVDGVFEGAFGALGDESWCFGEGF